MNLTLEIPDDLAARLSASGDIDRWLTAAGITTGRIFCAVHKGGGILRPSLTAQSIFMILVDCGQIMGVRFALVPRRSGGDRSMIFCLSPDRIA